MQFHFEHQDDSEDEYWNRWYHRPFAWMIGVGTGMSNTVAVIRGACICVSFLLGTDLLLLALGINISPLWMLGVPIVALFYFVIS